MEDQGANGDVTQAREACRRFEAQLGAYLEGEARPDAARHAAECAYCGALLADLQLIRRVSREFEPQEPPARLWANVRAALVAEGVIRPRRRSAKWQWLLRPAFAAGLAAVLIASVFYLRSGNTPRPRPSPPRVAAILDPSLTQTVDTMELTFRARSTSLDPGMKLAFEKGLNSLDTEIRECRMSLARQPNDALAREYLASAYSEKARVLASALELGDGNGH